MFAILVSLLTDEPRTIQDLGVGSGDLARRLVEVVRWVDAADFSERMIEYGKQLPNGSHPHLRWIYGKFEFRSSNRSRNLSKVFIRGAASPGNS